MNIWTITDVGAVRRQNQDAFRVEQPRPGQALVTVCDGMGGARAGNIASELAVGAFGDKVLELLADPERAGEPGAVLLEAVEAANQVVCARADTDPDCLGMGTTLVAALVTEERCHLVNVGDSRAYLASDEGIRRITRDHSLVEDLVRRGEITPEQARNHPQTNLITRALGAAETARPDLYQEPYTPGAFLLLCSDGLSNMVTDQEMLYEIIHGGEPSDCCKRLLDTALSRGAPDNVTAVLLQM